MANIPTAASGNWSNTATWSGGVLPGPGDDAQILTGHVVTLDQDATVNNITNSGNGQIIFTGSTPYTLTATTSLIPSGSSTDSMIKFDASYSAVGSVINTGKIDHANYQGTGSKGAIETLIGSTGSLTINCSGDILGDNNSTGGVSSPAITLGGSVDTTIYAARYYSGMIATINVTGSQNCDITLNASTSFQNRTIRIDGTGAHLLTLNGNIFMNANYAVVETLNPNTEIVMNGNITASAGATSSLYCLNAQNSSHITVNGNIDLTGASPGGINAGGSSAIKNVIVNGDITGPDFQNGYGLHAIYADVIVTGNITGGSGMNSSKGTGGRGVNLGYLASLTTHGDLYGGAGLSITRGGPAVAAGSDNTINIYGDVYATKGTFGHPQGVVYDTSSQSSIILGQDGEIINLYNTSTQSAMSSTRYVIAPGAKVVYHFGFYDSAGNWTDSITPITNADSDFAPSDVRSGVVYDSDSKVGTMEVPSPDDVLYGVPVDDTVGTAHIKMTDAAAVTGSQIETLST